MASSFEQKIQQALGDLRAKKFASIRAAAKAHNIDPTTLNRRSKGGISKQDARAAQQLLSQTQEGLLVRWILDSEARGYVPSHAHIRAMAILISEISGSPVTLGNNWVPRFLQRHPEIGTKVGRKLDALGLQNTTPAALEAWLTKSRRILLGRQVDTADVWNIAETSHRHRCQYQPQSSSELLYSWAIPEIPETREQGLVIDRISATGQRTRL